MPFTFYYDTSKSEDLGFIFLVVSYLCYASGILLREKNPSINSII